MIRHLWSSARDYWQASIRRQLIGAFGLVSLLMMMAAGYAAYAHQRHFLHEQGLRAALNLAHSLAVSSASWVAAADVVGLQEVTQGLARTDDLQFAAVLSRRGEVLASTRAEQVGRVFVDPVSRTLQDAPAEPRVLLARDDLIDVAAPIMAGPRHIGWARVEMTQATVEQNLRRQVQMGLAFTVAAALLAMAVSMRLARRLTRGLGQLVRVMGAVGHDGGRLRVPVSGGDEIDMLARDFNRMLDELDAQQDSLTQRNAELALYNEVLQQIGQGRPLDAVLEELARQIERLHPGVTCAILLLDQARQHLWLGVAPSVPAQLRQVLDGLPVAEDMGASGAAAYRRERVITEDVEQDSHWAPYRTAARKAGIGSCWSQPILDTAQQILGVFTLYRRATGTPTTGEIALIERCAHLAGLAIERKRQEDSQRIAATAFETQEAMYILDANRNIQRVNQAFSRITGLTPEEVIGQPVRILRSGHHDDAFYQRMWGEVQRTGAWQGEITNRRKTGEVYSKWLSITAVYDAQGRISHYVAGFFDVTQRKEAEAAIERLAFYDPLTGLPNRRLLLDRVNHALAGVRRNHTHGALLFLDLDNFKALNDTQGHDKGDLLLQEVARRLNHCVRETDTVARLGGDEFVLMLDGLDAEAEEAGREVEKISNKVLQALRQDYELVGVRHHSSASIGVTLFDANDNSVEDVLKRADLALYQAKGAGRNVVRFFEPAMQAAITARVALETDLRQGLAERQFVLFYQPQVDGAGRLTGAEALVRWRHPVRGLVAPGEFIVPAEEAGLILPLGLQVLELACAQLVRWAEDPATARLTLAVNVSARQVHQDDFVAGVLEVLARSGANPRCLKLELTESLLLENVDDTITKMVALKAHGVGFSLDDFGTGYSSLHYLKRLPLDQLKIDASFVQDALTNANDAAIIQAIVAMGHSLGLHVIAEGVETLAQREFLARVGCYACQGYLFGRPGPAEALEALVSRQAQPVSF